MQLLCVNVYECVLLICIHVRVCVLHQLQSVSLFFFFWALLLESNKMKTRRNCRWTRRMVDGWTRPSSAATVSFRASRNSDVCGYAFPSAFFQSVLQTFRGRRANSNASTAFDHQQPRSLLAANNSASGMARLRYTVTDGQKLA